MPPGDDTCWYYKPGYADYAPNGVPDFDQKQDAWTWPFTGQWTWCGPTAVANCLWWFDANVIDGLVNFMAWFTIKWSDVKMWFDNRKMAGIVTRKNPISAKNSRRRYHRTEKERV